MADDLDEEWWTTGQAEDKDSDHSESGEHEALSKCEVSRKIVETTLVLAQ